MSATRPWFAVARDVFEHDVVRRSPLCEVAAWLHLVSLANYADNPQHSPPLLRGQVCTSAGKLARAWGWERSRVKSEIARWERAGMVTATGIGRATVYTITGYDSWQSTRTNFEPTTNQPRTNHEPNGSRCDAGFRGNTNQPRTNHEPTTNQPRTATTRHVDTKTRKTEEGSPAAPSILSAAADANPSSDVDTGDAVEPTRREPDLTTKAGRARHYPTGSTLPKDGPRYVYPPEFVAFRAAYPLADKRAPGPATYRDWRKLVVDGVDPDVLVAAARAHAVESGGKFARRAHGPSGWLLSGDWQGVAEDATPVESSSRPADFGGLFDATDDEAWERRKAEHAEREAQRAAQREAADADYFDC